MRRSIDELKQRNSSFFQNYENTVNNLELISEDDASEIRGGDKEYNPPLYELKYKSIWQKANILLENLR